LPICIYNLDKAVDIQNGSWDSEKAPEFGIACTVLRTTHDKKEDVEVNEVAMLRGVELRKILQTVIEKKAPAIMSYLSNRKWHVSKVLPTNLGANRLTIETLQGKKPRPINIQVNQPVGISLKYEYGKFVFETKVVGLEPSPVPAGAGQTSPVETLAPGGGTIVLAVPDRIEIIQRRSYFRVEVPKSLKVNVLLWRRGPDMVPRSDWEMVNYPSVQSSSPPEGYWQGELIDISAGGAQIAVDVSQRPDLKRNQFIGLRFTPTPYERPLMFSAQIRNILPTADNKSICLGLQIVGLETSSEGRQVLQRLCSVVEQYYQINQSSAKQQDFQTTNLAAQYGS